jgi:threonyl-tRNA synthetase
MKSICNEKQPFERLELTKDELIEMFSYNQFKVRILKEKIKEERTTVYRCGTLIDLCRGPHVRHTGNVKAFKVTKVSILSQLMLTYAIK